MTVNTYGIITETTDGKLFARPAPDGDIVLYVYAPRYEPSPTTIIIQEQRYTRVARVKLTAECWHSIAGEANLDG